MKGNHLPFAVTLAVGLHLSTVHATQPNTPADLRSSWVDTVSAVLTWQDSGEADGFNVYRWDSPAQSWLLVSSQLGVPFYREIPPTVEPGYSYAVTATNADGESEPAVISVATGGWPGTMISPSNPDSYNRLAGSTTARLQFAADILSGVEAILEIGPAPDALQFWDYQPQYDTFHSFQVTNLSPATLYFYRYTYSETSRLGMTFTSYFYTLPPNAPPEVFPVEAEMNEDEGPLTVFPNGYDLDSYPPWPARIVRPPAHGIATMNESGDFFIYTPDPNFSGVDTFDYLMSDGELDSVAVPVTIIVHPVNDPGVNQTSQLVLATPGNTPVAGSVVIADPEGDPHTLVLTAAPESGSVQVTGTTFVFTPAVGFAGTIHFTLGAIDGNGIAALGATEVVVTVTPVDQPPLALAQSVNVNEDAAVSISLAASDPDGGPVTWALVSGPAHGALVGTLPSLTYTPDPNYNGQDSFTFFVSNGQAAPSTAVVSIQVNAVDDAPVGQGSTISTAEDSAIVCPIVATDIEGDALTFEVVRGPAHGSLSAFAASAPYSVLYTPEANFFGTDSFDLRATDGTLSGNVFTMSVTVSPVDDAPIATAQSFTTPEDQPLTMSLSAMDVDGGPITWQIISGPAHGVVTGTLPNLVYTPAANFNGSDAITVSVSDGLDPDSEAIISIQVTPVDDLPVALPQTVSTAEDQSLAITVSASDIDGGPINWQLLSGPSHGAVSGSLPNVIYTPALNYNGPDSFRFSVAPGSEAAVIIAVVPVNDAPVAVPQNLMTAYNTPINVNVAGSDIDSSVLTYAVLTSPANGTLSGTAPNLVFTPTIGWSGTTSFTFQVSDGQFTSPAATVTIVVGSTSTTPNAPSSLAAQPISNSQINLTWVDSSGNEDGFKIERSTGTTFSEIARVGPNVRSFASTGLAANKSYSYRVRAYNVRGNSAYSNTASAKTLR